MVPITSAANCFVDGMNEMQPVYRIDGDGNVSETGVFMSVSVETLNGAPWRLESVNFATAVKALNRVKQMFPAMSVKLTASSSVTAGKLPAIGTANANLYVVLGGMVALAPAWLLLANSVLTPGVSGISAADIEATVSRLRAGIWGEILDAKA